MTLWSELDVPLDFTEPQFFYDLAATVVCHACGRPSILDESQFHTCRADVSDAQSTTWSRQSASSAGRKAASTTGAPVQRKVRKSNLDLDRHCGVIIAPSGTPCMRSLTCKSHSAASKRAIIGRSKDFDTLLAEYIIANPSKAPNAAPTGKAGASAAQGPIARAQLEPVPSDFISNVCRFKWVAEPVRLYVSSRSKEYAAQQQQAK